MEKSHTEDDTEGDRIFLEKDQQESAQSLTDKLSQLRSTSTLYSKEEFKVISTH